MGWQQRFEKCHDRLVLRVGGPGGPLIHWPDRGVAGQCTWSCQDPAMETRDISPWVGDNASIRLYAMVLQTGETGDKRCVMTTLYEGAVSRQWVFDEDEDGDIARPNGDQAGA